MHVHADVSEYTNIKVMLHVLGAVGRCLKCLGWWMWIWRIVGMLDAGGIGSESI